MSIASILFLLFYIIHPYQGLGIGTHFIKPYYVVFLLSIPPLLIGASFNKYFYHGKILLFYMPFLAWIWVSSIYSLDQEYSVFVAAKYLICFLFAIFLSIVLVNQNIFWKKLSWAIIISSVIVSGLYLYKFYLYGIQILQYGASMYGIGALSGINVGFAGGRNLMSSWLSLTLTFPICALWFESKKKLHKIILGSCCIVISGAILLSLSRTSILSVICFFGIFYLITDNIKTKKSLRIISFICTIFVILIVYSNPGEFGHFLTHRFMLALNYAHDVNSDFGVEGRKWLWAYALKSISESPLFGTGIGTFYQKIADVGNYHNLWLQFFAQLGIIGLILFLFWIIIIIIRSFLLTKKLDKTPYGELSKIVFANLLVYYLKGLSMFQYFDMEIWTLIAFIVFLDSMAQRLTVDVCSRRLLSQKTDEEKEIGLTH